MQLLLTSVYKTLVSNMLLCVQPLLTSVYKALVLDMLLHSKNRQMLMNVSSNPRTVNLLYRMLW